MAYDFRLDFEFDGLFIVRLLKILLHTEPRQNWQQAENNIILKCTHWVYSSRKSTKIHLGETWRTWRLCWTLCDGSRI